MALNTALQVYRGLQAALPASTGKPGLIAWTTDSNRFYVDNGSAFVPVGSNLAVFTAADQTAMVALSAKVGDLCKRADTNLTYVLVDFPASTAANWVPVAVTSGTTIQGLVSGVAHEWVSYIDQSGVQHLSQPTFADIAGQLSQTQLPTSIGAGTSLTSIDLGTF